MGTCLEISIYVQGINLAEAYLDLIQRLLLKGEIFQGILYGESWRNDVDLMRKIAPQIIESEEWERNWTIDSRTMQSNLRTLVNAVEFTDKSLEVRLVYNFSKSSVNRAIDVQFFGENYHAGYAIRRQGPIVISMPLAYIRANRRETEASVSQQIGDAEELFLRICGLTEDIESDSHITHAAMYWEYGWPSPTDCQMAFHQNIIEFAHDFNHIFANYHYGIPMPLLLEGIDVFDLDSAEIEKLTTFQTIKYESPRERILSGQKLYRYDLDERIAFLESLDENIINQIESLPESEVKNLISQIPENISYGIYYDFGERSSIFPIVKFHDFGDKGYLLTTDPLSDLWRAYKCIADLALSQNKSTTDKA